MNPDCPDFCLICQKSVHEKIELEIGHIEDVIKLTIKRVEDVMAEREKAALAAAQALIVKENQEQLSKFVLKQELNDSIKKLQDQLTGPLGQELRMRALELSRGSLDAKMFMIIIGLSAFVTAGMTMFLRFWIKS
jgi:hypothetical protein